MENEMESELEELSQSVTDAKGTKKHWNACLASTREKYDVAAAEYAAARGDDVPEEENRLAFLSLSTVQFDYVEEELAASTVRARSSGMRVGV